MKPNSQNKSTSFSTNALIVFLTTLVFVVIAISASTAFAAPGKLPNITYPYDNQQDKWINSKPIKDSDLKGDPVLVFFWTYGCYNCHNSLEWINSVHARYEDKGLQVIGVHTPEFKHEKDAAKVAAKTKEFEIEFPVMIDNDFIFWKDMQNNYWPAFYLADASGNIIGEFIGEVHLDTDKASKIESLIDNAVRL